MPNPINVNRWQNKVRAMMGLRGENPIPTLKDLLPVVVVENDRPEFSFAGAEFLFGGSYIVAAAVGPSTGRLRNPVDSGVLAIVEGIYLSSDVATDMGIIVGDQTVTIGGVEVVGARRDRRLSGQGACLESQANAVGVGQGLVRIFLAASTPFFYPHPIILAPGTSVDFGTVTLNVALRASIVWRERTLERGLPS